MEFQKDNLVDVDYETMQQLVEVQYKYKYKLNSMNNSIFLINKSLNPTGRNKEK